MSTVLERVPSASTREIALARRSFAFLLDEMTGGVAGLDPLDALLVLAISSSDPNRIQRVSHAPTAPATAMAATVQAMDSAPMA